MKDPVLTALRQQLRHTPAPAAAAKPKPAPAAVPADEAHVDDAALFARATQGVKPLAAETPVAAPRTKRPDANTLRRRAAAVAEKTETGPISDNAALLHTAGPEEALSFARNGVAPRQLQKLKQGLLPWQAAVDLHGCSIDQARDAVLQLVAGSRREGLGVIKIVHGKGLQHGQALLKTCVNGWLRQLPEVLAFVSALPRDGGTGAVYVQLKKTSQGENYKNAHDLGRP